MEDVEGKGTDTNSDCDNFPKKFRSKLVATISSHFDDILRMILRLGLPTVDLVDFRWLRVWYLVTYDHLVRVITSMYCVIPKSLTFPKYKDQGQKKRSHQRSQNDAPSSKSTWKSSPGESTRLHHHRRWRRIKSLHPTTGETWTYRPTTRKRRFIWGYREFFPEIQMARTQDWRDCIVRLQTICDCNDYSDKRSDWAMGWMGGTTVGMGENVDFGEPRCYEKRGDETFQRRRWWMDDRCGSTRRKYGAGRLVPSSGVERVARKFKKRSGVKIRIPG